MHYSKTVRFEHQKAAIFAVTQSDATPKLAVGAFVPSLRFAVTQSDATPKLAVGAFVPSLRFAVTQSDATPKHGLVEVGKLVVLLLPRVTLLQN